MSAFGFTDQPVQNSGNNDESLFSFTDEPVDDSGNASEFSFGSAETTQQPAANEQGPSLFAMHSQQNMSESDNQKKQFKKKPVSRVIGQKKKQAGKKPKSKFANFAKKDGAEGSGKNLFAMKNKNNFSSDVHDSEASESDNPYAHEYGESQPETQNASDFESILTQKQQPSPMLNSQPQQQFQQPPQQQPHQQQQEESVFSFGGATNDQVEGDQQDDNASAFSFGQAESSPELNNTPPKLESNIPALNSQPSIPVSPVTSSVQSMPLSSQTSLPVSAAAESPTNTDDETPVDSELNEECAAFVRKLDRFARDLENAQNSYDKCTASLHDMEHDQSEALANEQFDVADQLNTQISNTRAKMLQSQTTFNQTITEAMALTNEAPQHFLEHANAAQIELPTLKVRKQALDKRLSGLKEEQGVDQQTIEIERKKNESLIDSLKKPVSDHEESHAQMEEELEKQVEASKKPFIDALEELKNQQKSHEDTIADLLKQIELHKKEIEDIKKKINTNQKQMKAAEDSFNGDRQSLADDKQQLQREHEELDNKIKEIEAPFQSLVDTVDKREAEIKGVSAAIEKISQQIDEGTKDSTSCESAANIINKLCQDHFRYSEQRQKAKDRFDNAITNAKAYEKRRDEINDETIEIRGKCQRASEFLNNAKLKVPQLESSKKAAIASKNFKGAQQINKELTSLNDQISLNEKLVTEETQQLEKLEGEASSITSDIAKAQVEVEESKLSLLQLDYNFFDNANTQTQKLCDISPFGEKLLRPLLKMMKFAVEHTEVPKQMSPEELQSEIDDLSKQQDQAVNDEDYDKAAALEEKISALKAKLELVKPKDQNV
ncbi:hypothetical protein M9Y10_029664 [Tritrichomonas musculus]|uniref:UVR domain-containing protein n=1 Tax=Tritrichomonas musculus TaxID=1915356 RepID=A0ABR2KMY1_9EUKA